MLRIGLTGGIGSGKTTVAKIFAKLNVPIFYGDDEAKKILISNNVKQMLKEEWGEEVFYDNKDVNKAALANIVFNDVVELQKLNGIIHPELLNKFDKWAKDKENEGYKYVILEAAILFEAGFQAFVNKTICVSATDEERIERVLKRDKATREQVISRMKNQWPQKKVIEISDYEIKNSSSDMILETIANLHNLFLN